jgi:drug/metabolite transporter (DMT)-like permease
MTRHSWKWFLAIAFFFNGLMSVSGKVLEERGLNEYLKLYLISYHSIAFLIVAVYMVLRKKMSISRAEWVLGGLIGVTSFSGLAAMIQALNTIDGVFVYSAVWGGSMILTAVLGTVLFKEKMTAKIAGAIVMGITGLILLL